MLFFNRETPEELEGEFTSAMPSKDDYDEYDDGYDDDGDGEYDEEDDEYDDEEDDGEEPPKSNVVKTAIIGLGLLLAVGGGAYYAASMFAPETLNQIVNGLPFIGQGEQDPNAVAGGEVPPTPPAPGASVDPTAEAGGPQPGDVTASNDVAAVPAPPVAKPTPMAAQSIAPIAKVPPKTAAAQQAARAAVGEGAPAAKPKPKAKPIRQATAPKRVWKPAPRTAWKPAPRAYGTRYASAQRRYYGSRARYAYARSAYYGRAAQYRRANYGRYAYGYKYKRAYGRSYGYAPRYSQARYAAPRYGRGYAVQVGSFADHGNASLLASQLRNQGVSAYVAGGKGVSGGSGFMVRSVAVRSSSSASRLARQYRAAGYAARVVPAGGGRVAVSVGTYGDRNRAEAVLANLNRQGLYGTVRQAHGAAAAPAGGLSRVYVGRYGNRQAAVAKMRQLQAQGIPAAVTSY